MAGQIADFFKAYPEEQAGAEPIDAEPAEQAFASRAADRGCKEFGAPAPPTLSLISPIRL